MFHYHSNYIYNYRQDGINLTKEESIVYHYTSPEGFLGILTSQNVRFTDIKYMNDRSEGVYFVKLLLDYIDKNKNEYPSAAEVINRLLGENNLEEIKTLKATNIKYRLTEGKIEPARAFLFCTCVDADSLNMWNYYVKNGSYQGYNIGFRVDAFLETIAKMFPENHNISIYYGKVLYTLKQQQEEIKNLLQTIEDAANDNSLLNYAKSNALELYLKRYIDLYGVFYKHHKFAGEQEFRFVIEFDYEFSNRAILDFRDWIDSSKTITEDFCIKNGIITPFLNVPFDKKTISRVYISPMTEFAIAKRSIKEIIYKKGYRVFPVHQSKIPIRY